MANPAAGWYPDPNNPAQRRYWDGAKWTEHTDAGGQQAQQAQARQPQQPQAQPQQPQAQPQQPQAPAEQAVAPAAAAQPQRAAAERPQAPFVAQPGGVAVSKPGPPGIGIAGFVTGLLGLILSVSVICWFIGLPLAIIGTVLGALGIRQSNERGAPKGLSMAGMICGIIGIVAGVIITVAVVLSS